MSTNVIDRRKRKYRFLKVNAVVEAAWHDNHVKDEECDQIAKPKDDGPSYEEREHVTVGDAILWGTSFGNPVTLYLYDEDGCIYAIKA